MERFTNEQSIIIVEIAYENDETVRKFGSIFNWRKVPYVMWSMFNSEMQKPGLVMDPSLHVYQQGCDMMRCEFNQ